MFRNLKKGMQASVEIAKTFERRHRAHNVHPERQKYTFFKTSVGGVETPQTIKNREEAVRLLHLHVDDKQHRCIY